MNRRLSNLRSGIIIVGLLLVFWVLRSDQITQGQNNPTPINGSCGSLSTQATATDNTYPSPNNNFYCNEWETDNIFYDSTVNKRIRTCQWLYGWDETNCSYSWSSSTVINTGTCGWAHTKSFETTLDILGNIYSNMNNSFLSNLCMSWSTKLLPSDFNESSLGWTWNCPGTTNECFASRYQNALCGIAANTGHTTPPTTHLCSPGTIAWPVLFNNETYLFSRECDGNGGANDAYCTARLYGDNNLSPTCNATVIEPANTTYTYDHITSFPGSQWCLYGTINNRSVWSQGQATWNCINNGQNSSTCWNIPLIGRQTNLETACNTDITNQSFDNTYQLLQYNLCDNGGIPTSFTTNNKRRRRKCGYQTCEALMSTKYMCWRATKQPWKNYPTQGICTAGTASSIKTSNSERWRICTTNTNNIQKFENSSCTNYSCLLNVLDFYNGETAVCSAPRIVDGICKRQTQINPAWYNTPDDLLQAWLCESGIPNTLIPSQDTINKKWKRTCTSTHALGQDSDICYAKVRLPVLGIQYMPHYTDGVITSVTAYLTGFQSPYITFTNPYHQHYRLFTQNGSFLFEYKDRAGNTGNTLAVVDAIQSNLPTATIQYSPSSSTSGTVTVSLTGFNRPQIPAITFIGTCINNGTCTRDNSYHPSIFTITYRQNGTWIFTITDSAGIVNTIPFAVNTIDKTPPTTTIQYSNTNPTNTWVIASLVNPSEIITITNNNGQNWYYFADNGSFTFHFKDSAGNTGSRTATINWINRNAPSATVTYSTSNTTKNNVTATLTNFTTPGTVVTNNSGQISYIFTHNTEFIFLLKDQAGNVWSVIAKVNNIDKPITSWLIAEYEDKLCSLRTPSPIDTNQQQYNYYIQTVINNCIMKTSKGKNNYRYFYPRKNITRGEFITAVGRMINLTTQYSGSIIDTLSPDYLQAHFDGIEQASMGEADMRWLLIYSPLMKKNGKRTTDLKQSISSTEAQRILQAALTIMGNTTNSKLLIKSKGNLTKAQAAYAFGTLLSQYDHVALGNHHTFLQSLYQRIQYMTSKERKTYITSVIKKLQNTSSLNVRKLWLHPEILLQDLKAIALGTTQTRKTPRSISIETVVDNLIKNTSSSSLPVNNNDKTYNNNFFNFWDSF